MSSTLLVFERLHKEAEAAGNNECREHVLEQAHYAVDDVQQKMLSKFDTLVHDIGEKWGPPEFNARTDIVDEEEKRNPIPNWVTNAKITDASQKILKLSYWRRDGSISYVLLRIELDSKDRPNYYDLVLGARYRRKSEAVKMDKLRHADTSMWSWIRRKLGLAKADL